MKAAAGKSEAQRYFSLPYIRELVREDDGSWFARVIEFPGCMTVGDTREEALEMLDDAMGAWIEAKLADRETIPAPMTADEFSGRFVVRVTKTLHRDLVRAAERNGVSLNQYVLAMLARSAGTPTPDSRALKRSKAVTQVSALRSDYGSDMSPGGKSALKRGRKKP